MEGNNPYTSCRRLAVLIAVMLMLAPLVAAAAPVLDPREGPVALEGPWEFYWSTMLHPGEAELRKPDAHFPLPGSWTQLRVDGQPLPAAGFASVRKVVRLADAPREGLVLRVPMVYSAYALFIDGEQVASVGQVGTAAEESEPDYGERRIRIDSPGREVELLFHVSNFSSRAAGFPIPLQLGTPEAITRALSVELISNAALAGGLLLLGLSQLVLYLLRREGAYLFIGLTVVFWGLQTILSGQLLAHAGWHLPIEFARPLDGFTALAAASFYLLFLSALFPRELPLRYTRWVLLPLAIYLGVAAFGSELLRSETVGWLLYLVTGTLALAIVQVARAWWRGAADAGLILVGSAVIAVTALIQVIWFNEAGIRDAIANAGALVAVALHSVTLARRYSRAFSRSQQLEHDLRRANRLKDEFLANTSHELRTPLHAMIGMAESLPRDQPRLARGLDLIAESGHRLARLVDDILAFTRLKYDDLDVEPSRMRLGAVIHTILETSRPLIGDRPLRLQAAVDTALPPVEADPDRIHQVLFNLVGNAIRHTDRGCIAVSARHDGDAVVVEVEDEGMGIPEEDLERLQEPYEQGIPSSHEGRGGVGLGLAIVRRILERHGTRLELESTPGRGTRARFRLPVAGSLPAAASDSPTEPAPMVPALPDCVSTPGSPAPTGEGHILVVDDEESTGRVVEEQLRLVGYGVERVSSGAAALDAVEQRPPRLVLLDVMMPDMSGLTVCRRLREHYDLNTLPVILVTARTRLEDTIEGLEAGANDYLAKPYYRQELLARVEAQLRVQENEQMRWALAEQTPNEDDDPRTCLVELLTRAVRYWEAQTGLARADLAEQSGLWTVTQDDSTRKTRTLDRYRSLDTLPQRPRWSVVTRTARFVIQRLESPEQIRELEALLERLERSLA